MASTGDFPESGFQFLQLLWVGFAFIYQPQVLAERKKKVKPCSTANAMTSSGSENPLQDLSMLLVVLGRMVVVSMLPERY